MSIGEGSPRPEPPWRPIRPADMPITSATRSRLGEDVTGRLSCWRRVVLYGLLRRRAIGAAGSVAMLPSDHYISDDEAFAGFVRRAFQAVEARPDLVILLGVAPDSAEVGYGWIEPGEGISSRATDLYRVRRFWEKPSAALAQMLLTRGCL